MYKEIAQKILDVLKADATLDAAVKTWYFGEHDIRKPNTRYPFIDVKWVGGPIKKLKTGATITRRQIDFQIRCIQRHVDEATAEKFVMENTEQIETVLDANETLDGLVETSTVFEAISDSIPLGGYAVVGSITRLQTKK